MRVLLFGIVGVTLGVGVFLSTVRTVAHVEARDAVRTIPIQHTARPTATPTQSRVERFPGCSDVDLAAVEKSSGCSEDETYPSCRWRLPDALPNADYRIWRNTTPDHRWARPGLVAALLRVARTFHETHPESVLTIGDLDAPGPRHQTHDRGVDVDLYLEDSMIARNDGGGSYPDNYAGRSAADVAEMRARVLFLAQILARCTGGDLRIYYNDEELVRTFRAWFSENNLQTSFSHPMLPHNALHRFHFHMRVADELRP